MINITNSTETIFDGKTYSSLLVFLAARRVLGANRFKFKDTDQTLSAGINSAYTHTGNLLDKLVATQLNAKYVTSTSGRGVIFDNIIIENDKTFSISENKLVSSVVNASGAVEKVSQISVAGGSGINLTAGTKTLFTGKDFRVGSIDLSTDSVDISEAGGLEEVSISKYFISELLSNKGNQQKLKNLIDGNSKAAIALRKNFELKSSTMNVVLSINGKPAIKTIGWDWEAIKSNPKARIAVSPDGKGGVNFNIYFTPAAVRDALNKAETLFIDESKLLANNLANMLSEELAAFSPSVIAFLKSYNVDIKHTYDTNLYLGSINDTSKIEKESTKKAQQFVTNAQWTSLVQRRLGATMVNFGDPAPPYLKNRDGNFKQSVSVAANYRTRTLQYTYNPLYKSLEKYGYVPEQQIEKSIRQVAQELYSKAFNIVRAGI